MTNFGSVRGLTVPEGKVKSISRKTDGLPLWKAGYKNWVPYSINPDGTIYNGIGYKDKCRIRSGGTETATNYATCTGFIPAKPGDAVRISGCLFNLASNNNSINLSNADFINIGQFTMIPAHYGIMGSIIQYGAASVMEEKTGIWKWIVPADTDIAFIRVTGFGETICPGSNLIVTVNEEII